MIQLSILILSLLSLTSISGSRGSGGKLNRPVPSDRITEANSSNSETTSSEDSDNWEQAKEPKFSYTKTYRDYGKNNKSRLRNIQESAEWDMEGNIGVLGYNFWQSDSDEENPRGVPITSRPVELEDQVNPERNVTARIMAQYRRDLGFKPVGNFTDSEPEQEEIQKFMKCFESRPRKFDYGREERREKRREKRETKLLAIENPEKRREKAMIYQFRADWKVEKKKIKQESRRRKLSEAYSFLKYLGKIPQYTKSVLDSLSCEEIRAQNGKFQHLQDIRAFYKTELNYYTLLNWDNLDLTHFRYHHFPIMNQITRNITYLGNSKVISPPVLMSRGLNVLAKYEKSLRFHNPRTIQGRRMLLFQRLYRRYLAVMEKDLAHPSFIDWKRCEVVNWPEHIDRSNFNNWSKEDILLLENLIENGSLIFKMSKKLLNGQPAPLGWTENFNDRPVIDVEADKIEGDECAISDDEKICGKPGMTLEEAKELAKIKAAEQKATERKAAAGARKTDNKVKAKRIIKPVAKPKATLETTSSPNSSVSSESDNCDPFPEIRTIKVDSKNPADPEELARVSAQALEIFRKKSGQFEAQVINWSLLNVSKFQNHMIPFSTGFETEGDVKTLANAIKTGTLSFHNLNHLQGRIMRVYERLFEKCGKDIGFHLDEFLIKWTFVNVKGWPEGVKHVYGKWKNDDVRRIEAQLDKEEISFELNGKLSKALEESKHLKSEDGSSHESSEDSPDVERVLLKDYNSEAFGPLYTGFDVVNKTPSFAAAVLTPTNRKRSIIRSESYDGTEEDVPAKPSEKKKTARVQEKEKPIKIGDFAGLSRRDIQEFVVSVNDSIAQYKAVRASKVHCPRKNRILSEIIRALELILQHANSQKVSDVPRISVNELNEFIGLCCDILLAVDADDYLDVDALRLFVVTSVNLRARLSGAPGSLQQVTIKKGIIADMEMFGYLATHASSDWNVEFLEEFLDEEALPIFKTTKTKH